MELLETSATIFDPNTGNQPFGVTASTGLASADLALNARDLLSQADAAMHRAKLAGRDQPSG